MKGANTGDRNSLAIAVLVRAGEDGHDGDPDHHNRCDEGCAEGDSDQVGQGVLHLLEHRLCSEQPGLASDDLLEVGWQSIQHISLIRDLQSLQRWVQKQDAFL